MPFQDFFPVCYEVLPEMESANGQKKPYAIFAKSFIRSTPDFDIILLRKENK